MVIILIMMVYKIIADNQEKNVVISLTISIVDLQSKIAEKSVLLCRCYQVKNTRKQEEIYLDFRRTKGIAQKDL